MSKKPVETKNEGQDQERRSKPAKEDIRSSVDFSTDMIKTQQDALVKTMQRYEQRDNPLEQTLENIAGKLVNGFLTLNEKIVNSLPNDTRLRFQKTWQDFLLAF